MIKPIQNAMTMLAATSKVFGFSNNAFIDVPLVDNAIIISE